MSSFPKATNNRLGGMPGQNTDIEIDTADVLDTAGIDNDLSVPEDVESTSTFSEEDIDIISEPSTPTLNSGSGFTSSASDTVRYPSLSEGKRGMRKFYTNNSGCDSSSTLRSPGTDDKNPIYKEMEYCETPTEPSPLSIPVPDVTAPVLTPALTPINTDDNNHIISNISTQISTQGLSRTSSFTSILHPSAHVHRARHNHYHQSLPTLKQQAEKNQQLEAEQASLLAANLRQAQQQNMSLDHIMSSPPSSSMPMHMATSVSIPALSSPIPLRNTSGPGYNGSSSVSSSFNQMTAFGSYIQSPPDSPNLDPTSLCGSPNNLLLAPSPLSLSYINMGNNASYGHGYSNMGNGGYFFNAMSPAHNGNITGNTPVNFSLNPLSRRLSRSSSSTTLPIQIPNMNMNNVGVNIGSFKHRHSRKSSNTKANVMLPATKENQIDESQGIGNDNSHSHEQPIEISTRANTLSSHNNCIGLESPVLEPLSTPYQSVPMTPLLLSFDRSSLSSSNINNNATEKLYTEAFKSNNDGPYNNSNGFMELSLDSSLNSLTYHNTALALDDIIDI